MADDLSWAFRQEGIFPDLMDHPPHNFLKVSFKGTKVELGNEFYPEEVRDEPAINYNWEGFTEKIYTLIFTDPDFPSRETRDGKEYLHWLIVNIPGANWDRGQILAEYVAQNASHLTGLHRCTFLLFEQQGMQVFTFRKLKTSHRDARLGFNTRKFVQENGLNPIPKAGNFFIVQAD